MKRIVLLSIALVSMLSFTSCTSPKKQAEKVTTEFFEALNNRDYDKALSYTASEQASAYVDLMKFAYQSDSTNQERATMRVSDITRTEELQDTIICYVETIEPSEEPTDMVDTLNQKVILTKVDNKWKIVEIPLK